MTQPQPQPMQPQRRLVRSEDAEERLHDFAMTVEMIHRIISVGDSARRKVMLPVYPATYPGTVMWAETLAAWRRELRKRSREYDIGRSRGYETVFSAERQVAFTVVAGDSFTGKDGARAPRLTRPKGIVTKERVDRNRETATGLVQLALIPADDDKKPPADELCDTWFLIVYAAKNEVRIELSLPVELDGDSVVSDYHERILLPPVPISGAITPMTPEGEGTTTAMVDHLWSADKAPGQSFNPTRLTLARERNGLTKQQLADACQVTRRAVSAWEAGEVENPPTTALARVLGFPEPFFYADDPVPLSEDGVSFRALKSMSARQLDRVLAAGSLAIEFSAWMNSNYTTPVPDLPDLSDSQCLEPSLAAESVRSIWGIHQAAVKNLLLLLEEKGIRVFSLPVSDREVDAFSFWYEDRPFIFLDTARTSERMRFDLAHELGHLLLHRQTKSLRSRNVEQQAQDFASSFLIPADGLYAQVKGQLRLEDVFELKRFWRVSAVAMVQRLWHLSIISDWHYRTWMVELSSRGFRTSEPGGIRPETSRLFRELFKLAREDGWSVKRIALALHMPEKEIDGMVFGLAIASAPPDTPASGQQAWGPEFGRLTRAK